METFITAIIVWFIICLGTTLRLEDNETVVYTRGIRAFGFVVYTIFIVWGVVVIT